MICRNYFKWNINELLRLQREYELLELDIHEISLLHQRSIRSILFKLEKEGFICNWDQARGFEKYINSQPDLLEYKNMHYNNDYEKNSDVSSEGEILNMDKNSFSDISDSEDSMHTPLSMNPIDTFQKTKAYAIENTFILLINIFMMLIGFSKKLLF